MALSGVDGSGKTTQIELLEKKVRTLRPNAITVWSRWRPITSLPLLAIIRRLGQAEVHSTSSIGFVETQISGMKGLASLWCFLVQLDNLLKTGARVLLPRLLGRTVICDRYALDLMVEGMADLHDGPNNLRLGYKLLHLLPRPDVAFLIEVDPAVAYRRKPDMPTLAHFEERVKLYHDMSRMLGVKSIDGGKSVDVIHDEIWRKVSRLLES